MQISDAGKVRSLQPGKSRTVENEKFSLGLEIAYEIPGSQDFFLIQIHALNP